jgi:putative inorganic carbon (hco3(-)) transporter
MVESQKGNITFLPGFGKNNLVYLMLFLMSRIGAAISRFELWFALILAGISLYEPDFLPIALAGFFVILVFRVLGTKRVTKRSWVDLPVAILLVMSVLSLLVSVDFPHSWEQVMRLWVGVGLFYSIINWVDSQSRLRLLLRVVVLTGLVLAVITPVITMWNDEFLWVTFSIYRSIPALTQDLANPNVIAGTLSLFFFLDLGLLIFAWQEMVRIEKMVVLISLVTIGVLIVFTQSRGVILATIISLIILSILKLKKVWLISIVFIALFLLVYGSRGNGYQFVDFLTSGTTVAGITGRTEIWAKAIFMLEDFPFTGIGMGMFGPVADTLYPFYLYPVRTI